jgi:benzoate 4-monooxygenase
LQAKVIVQTLYTTCTTNTVCIYYNPANFISSFIGTFVRLAPNHISIADPDALQLVYAHGNGSLKSDFYDAFVSIHRGLFNTRDRADHARKRKIVSNVFSQKNVLEFEPSIRLYVTQFMNQWDRLFDKAVKNQSGSEGEGGWLGKDGRLWLDCLPCK